MSDEMRNEFMLRLTEHMPRREILVSGKPYLERYFVGESGNGEQVWIHRFLQSDQDRFFHSHPWFAQSLVVSGGYVEASMNVESIGKVETNFRALGDTIQIEPTTLHRITAVDPHTWTMLKVGPNWIDWFFVNEEGELIEMKKEHGPNWHAQYVSRHEAEKT